MQEKIINDFSITIATINGSGSQTANVTLLRALFKMGIPVSGKNLFPSNIKGLPTWYTIRLSKDGFTARQEESEVVVSLNPTSMKKDMISVKTGGIFLFPDDIAPPIERKDIHLYPMPVKSLSRSADISPSLRNYIANMVYVGVLAYILGIDMEKIHQALTFHFKGKVEPINSNFKVIQNASEWARLNLSKQDLFYVEEMDKNHNLIMTDGNTAAALGAIYGGVQFAAWYPITPASSLAESLNVYLPRLRKLNGKATYAIMQAEDEIAAIGMTIGAGWSGLRAMTSTSGPGISLMSEFAGLAYLAEVPIVVWNVQRVGPSTGLPTRTSQGDLGNMYFYSHGDTRQIILLPGSVEECFEFGWKAFDLAEHMQMPVFVLSDLDLGMNQWMTKPFNYPDTSMNRGKVLWEDDLEKLKGNWARYKDIDGDGIPYRTVPGNQHPAAAWFCRGTGHDENANLSEDSVVWESLMKRLMKKFETARNLVPPPICDIQEKAKIGVIAYGSSTPAVEEARYLLAKQDNFITSFMRLRAFPCTKDVIEFINHYDRIYIVENNCDGQLKQILSAVMPGKASRFRSIAHSDGLPLSATWIKSAIQAQEVE